MNRPIGFILGLFVATLSACGDSSNEMPEVTVAVASNFLATAEEIGAAFSQQSLVRVIFVSGSTGKLAAQIQQGAPFDVFLSADRAAPAYLVERGSVEQRKPVTYAIGRLALYSNDPDLLNSSTDFPARDQFKHLAIANPELAPYGRAARETLTTLNLWDALEERLVRGENIAQTWHFVSSGNADLGLVALSQLPEKDEINYYLIPQHLHAPIEQDAILIHDSTMARHFLNFLSSPPARRIIQSHGYDLPPLTNAK